MPPPKHSWYFMKRRFLDLKLRIFLYFFRKKPFLLFQEMKLSYILGKGNTEKIPYILENGIFLYFRKRKHRENSLYFRKRNFLIFHEVTFRARKIKKPTLKNFLIFREMELSRFKLKKILIFQHGNYFSWSEENNRFSFRPFQRMSDWNLEKSF